MTGPYNTKKLSPAKREEIGETLIELADKGLTPKYDIPVFSEIGEGVGIIARQIDDILPTTPWDNYIPNVETLTGFLPGVGAVDDKGKYSPIDVATMGLGGVAVDFLTKSKKIAKGTNKVKKAVKGPTNVTPPTNATNIAKNRRVLFNSDGSPELQAGAFQSRYTIAERGRSHALRQESLPGNLFSLEDDLTRVRKKIAELELSQGNVSDVAEKMRLSDEIAVSRRHEAYYLKTIRDHKLELKEISPNTSEYNDLIRSVTKPTLDETQFSLDFFDKMPAKEKINMKFTSSSKSHHPLGISFEKTSLGKATVTIELPGYKKVNSNGEVLSHEAPNLAFNLYREGDGLMLKNIYMYQNDGSPREVIQSLISVIKTLPKGIKVKEGQMTFDSLHLFLKGLAKGKLFGREITGFKQLKKGQYSGVATHSTLSKLSNNSNIPGKDVFDYLKKLEADIQGKEVTKAAKFDFSMTPTGRGVNYQGFEVTLNGMIGAIPILLGVDNMEAAQKIIDEAAGVVTDKPSKESREEDMFKTIFGPQYTR